MDCRPVLAQDIAQSSFEQAYHIEDVLLRRLIRMANEGIREKVCHGKLQYCCRVPPFVFGYPRYDANYIATRLRESFMETGFQVDGDGLDVHLRWKRATGNNPTLASTTRRPTPTPLLLPPPPPPPPRQIPEASRTSIRGLGHILLQQSEPPRRRKPKGEK